VAGIHYSSKPLNPVGDAASPDAVQRRPRADFAMEKCRWVVTQALVVTEHWWSRAPSGVGWAVSLELALALNIVLVLELGFKK
jgi:hypothetical protein